jgi:Tol biopolymer transport system component
VLAFASDRSGDGNFDIWVQQVGANEPVRLTRHPANDYNPQFSPDGTQIAFRSDRDGGGLYVMPALGGGERLIMVKGNRPRYSPDGKWIAYTVDASEAYVIPATGGVPRQIQVPCCPIVAYPTWVGAGRLLVYARPEGKNEADSDWWVTSLEGGSAIRTGAVSVLKQHGLSGKFGLRFVPGFWSADRRAVTFSAVYRNSTDLWELKLSPDTWRVSGSPRRLTFLTSGSLLDLAPSSGPGGRIAFMSANSEIGVWSGALGSEPGDTHQLQRVRQRAFWASVTRDGMTMVFNKLERSGNLEVWLRDLRSRTEIPIATSGVPELWPKISPDGQKVAYAVLPASQIRVWSSSRPEPTTACDHCAEPWTWSSDGRYLLVRVGESRRIAAVEFGASPGMDIVYESPGFRLQRSRFSPDDRWVAFAVQKGEVSKIFVAPFRGRVSVPRSEWQELTTEDVVAIVVGWSTDGTLVYYLSDRDAFRCLWAQPVDTRTKRPTGPPVEVYPIHRPFAALELKPGAFEAAMSHDSFFFSMGEMQGDIWMLTPR